MFRDFYQMQEEPFGVTPDHRFLYLGDSHREALASLYCGIEADRGFMVLIAPPGLGKTTLIFQLIEKLRPDARTVFLFQTQCNSRELIQFLLNDLGVDVNGMETVAMHNKLNQILLQERLAGRRFVLIVDEAQNLDPGVLETIRLLSNFETSQSKLLQILLVGQPQLARKLASSSLEQLQQRISMFAKVEPFSADETARYIAHRLKVAGYTGDELFTSGAMEIIKDRSKGVPRNINRLCFSALSLGCAMGRKRIDADMMREVVADLDVESHQREAPHQLMLAPSVSSPAETAADISCHLLSRGIQQPAPTMGDGHRRRGRVDSHCSGIGLLFPWLDRKVLTRENRAGCHHPESLAVQPGFCAGCPRSHTGFFFERNHRRCSAGGDARTSFTERRHAGPIGRRA